MGASILIAAPPPGRRERRKAVTRAELILAGRRLFSEKGLYESRVEDLTRMAGIAKGTLYQYFWNKEDLIQAVVAIGFEDLGRLLAAEVHGARTLAGRTARIADAHLAFFAENPDLMRIFHQVRGMLKFDHAERAPLRVILRRHLDLLTALLDVESTSAGPGLARRREIAVLLFGSVSGITSVHAAVEMDRPGPGVRKALGPALAAAAAALLDGGASRRQGGRGAGGRRPRTRHATL